MSQENVETVTRFSIALQRGDLPAALSVLDDDVEWRDQAAIPGADVHRGPEAVGRHIAQWRAAWKEIEYTPEEVRDCGNRVLVVARRHGEGYGSGVSVGDQVIYVFTVSSDKIVRFEGFSDKTQALEAAGLSE